jgi:serine beta-lactamase-like protein LACTB, mitochondrial
VFNWASNSKPLAAVSAMQLVEQKKLDLDADVRTLVPEFPDPGAVITCRHLLCHQSGIVHYSNGRVVRTERNYNSERPFLDPVIALDTFNKSPLLFAPGEKTSYSSHAYILLSAAIQRAGQADFHEQIVERIARPLTMEGLDRDFPTTDQPHWSVGYTKLGELVVRSPEEANYWKHGAGGYKSNIEDFARWAAGLINYRVLSEGASTSMWTAQNNSAGEPAKWGLGFTVENLNGQLKVSHNGGQPETATRMVLYPRARHGVVIMSNSRYADVGAISTAVYSALK